MRRTAYVVSRRAAWTANWARVVIFSFWKM
jgi:hypothetical protein